MGYTAKVDQPYPVKERLKGDSRKPRSPANYFMRHYVHTFINPICMYHLQTSYNITGMTAPKISLVPSIIGPNFRPHLQPYHNAIFVKIESLLP